MKPQKPPNNPRVELRSPTVFVDGVEERDEYFLATGVHARRVSADLDELRALRLKRTGGSVFSRKGSSRFLQIKYPDGKGGWRYESARTQNRHDAEALLRLRAYEASAGNLPGTATFEQIIERLLDAAKVAGLKSVARMTRAAKALRKKFEGSRAEQIDGGAWRKFAMERLEQAAPDTVNYELSIAKRAYRLARTDGLLRSIPEFPRIKNLTVRRGFIEAEGWRALRERLQPDFRDAADFALMTSARLMETLSIGLDDDVELDARVIHLRHTKTGVARAIPFDRYPPLAELVARRLSVHRALACADINSPWFFCFVSQPHVVLPGPRSLNERTEKAGSADFVSRFAKNGALPPSLSVMTTYCSTT